MDARTPDLVRAIKASDLLLDRDPWGASWIAAHRSLQASEGHDEPSGCRGGPRRCDAAGPDGTAGDVAVDGGDPVHDGRGRLDLLFEPAGRKVRVPPGVMLFDAASWNGIAIDSTCGGHGTCRKCKVKVLDGSAPITSLDTRAFSTDELRGGWRLACRVQVSTDLRRGGAPARHSPEGGHRRGRAKGDSPPCGPEALCRADRADALGPDDRSRAPLGEPRRPRAATGSARAPLPRNVCSGRRAITR